MERLYDRLILLICCSIFLLSVSLSADSLISILAAVFFSSVITYFHQESVNVAIYLVYTVFCLFYPNLIFLFPLMSYELICEPYRAVLIFGVFSLVKIFFAYPPLSVFYILALVLLSFFLRKRTLKLERSQEEYLTMKDSLTAMTSRLRAQNRDLLEKQDYEIKNATLDERNRIAREIHDTVGHLISSALLQIGALLAICSDENMKSALSDIKKTLSEGMDNIRASIHNIHEDSLDLNAKLSELIHNFTFCEVSFIYEIENDFSMHAKYSLISIIKEALANVMKHSTATLVTVSLKELSDKYEITVHDNGKQTFLPDAARDTSGMGIIGIEERVSGLDGHFHIDRSDGYMLYISLPKDTAGRNPKGDK